MFVLVRSKRLRILRRHKAKGLKSGGTPVTAPSTAASASGGATAQDGSRPVGVELPASAEGLPEIALRNIALEAVRVGNYFAEADAQAEVLSYIREQFLRLLNDARWLKKYTAKNNEANAFTERYTVSEILAKKHEADGYDVFVQPHEALAKKKAEEAAASGATPQVFDPAIYGELQDGLTEVAAAAAGDVDPVGTDELVELLEGCAKVGELAATVYCGERLEAVHGDSLPDDAVERAFAALKPLLRPSAANSQPRLTGPWEETGARRRFGKLLDRFGQMRKSRALARGGEVADKADRIKRGEEVLGDLCTKLLPLLQSDSVCRECKRRGPLVVEISRVCKSAGLDISTPVAWDVLRILEQRGDLVVSGRDARIRRDESASTDVAAGVDAASKLDGLASELPLLDELARERLERRAQRRKARERGKMSKKSRTVG